MGFGGGGSAGMTAHVHNNVPLQGGPLDFANDTIASLNAGSTTFSDGAALQELVIGNPADTLVVNGAGTAPEWGGGGGGAWTQVFTDTLGADTNAWTNTFAGIGQNDNALYCLNVFAGFDNDSDILMRLHDGGGAVTTGYYNDGIKISGGGASYENQANTSEAMIGRHGNRKNMICTVWLTMGTSSFTDSEMENIGWTSSCGVLQASSYFGGCTMNAGGFTSLNGVTLYADAVGGARVFEAGSKMTLWKIA